MRRPKAIRGLTAALLISFPANLLSQSRTPLIVFSSNGKDIADVEITNAASFSAVQFSSAAVQDGQRSLVARAWSGENGITVRLELARGPRENQYRSPIGEFTVSPTSPVFVSKDELYGLPAISMRVIELTARCAADPSVVKNDTQSLALVGILDSKQGAECDFLLQNRSSKKLAAYYFRKKSQWFEQGSAGFGAGVFGEMKLRVRSVAARKPGQALTKEDLLGWELAAATFEDGTSEGDAKAIQNLKGLPERTAR